MGQQRRFSADAHFGSDHGDVTTGGLRRHVIGHIGRDEVVFPVLVEVIITSVEVPSGNNSEFPTTGPGPPSAFPWTAMNPGAGSVTDATTIEDPSEV